MFRKFQFPQRSFYKYKNFASFDDVLDIKTSVKMSRDLRLMFNNIFEHTQGVELCYGNHCYDAAQGYFAFHKAMFTDLAMRYWEPKVGRLEITRDIQNSMGMRFLKNMKNVIGMQDSVTEIFTIRMPRLARRIFNEPIRILGVFSLSFAVEYCLSSWLLENTQEMFGAFLEDIEYRNSFNTHLIENTMERVREIIRTGM